MMFSRVKNNFLQSLAVCFLICFMIFIFGPAEIYFSNIAEFEFVYKDFWGELCGIALLVTVFMCILISAFPDKIYGIALSTVFGVSLAGYIQIMFFNKNLDLLGVNPEGYKASATKLMLNTLVWIVIVLLMVTLFLLKREIWKQVIKFFTALLLGVQVVAYLSLLFTAPQKAWNYEKEGWFLSGEEQYTVSANENVIVIVLDYFSNQYMVPLHEAYPNATDFLHDFTYYSNMDCVYWGTFPSLPHLLTGQDVAMDKPIDEWFQDIWNNDSTRSFYEELKEKNYKVNIYTPDLSILCGKNEGEILKGKVSNIEKASIDITVNNADLVEVIAKMSGYRFVPEILKNVFYTDMGEYSNVTTNKNEIRHNNYDFYDKLLVSGLKCSATSNYYIVQHLMGPHVLSTDEKGNYKENATLEETTMGCMVIVEEYLEQLKQLGVYDNSTIIITSDHGGKNDSQVIFYLKQAGEKHDVSPINNAPVSFDEYLPTIAMLTGQDTIKYGKTIFDFTENEQRERTLWIRGFDDNYPVVPHYVTNKDGTSNVYYGYTYIGDNDNLYEKIQEGPSIIAPMADCFF